jgi:ribosomal-protein-alanine N-acetyltransferase
MYELQLLRPDHAPAVLTFERENREYFASWVADRGDDYFASFAVRHRALLAEQSAGTCYFHVVVDSDGEVVGRVNLVDVADGSAELGFRIAERLAGHGLATSAVRQICGLASTEYGLRSLRAATAPDNLASQAVLTRAGFVLAGPGERDGQHELRFVRHVTVEGAGGQQAIREA